MKHSELLDLTEKILTILDRRFFSKQNVLFDYAGMNGEVILPTPEECDKAQPNGLSWHTPISNGAFFNGDLLTAVVKIYDLHPSPRLASFARKLLDGLFNLQTLAPHPAFIVRGFGSDGKCCYPGSSNDQIVPFLLGVRTYANSTLATGEERSECRRRMLELILALRELDWRIPGSKPGFERGCLKTASPFDACHLLLPALILEEEKGEKGIVEKFLQDRLDILKSGYPGIRPGECWYASHNFFILRMLKEFFEGSEYAAAFENGLKVTAQACLKALPEWKNRVPDSLFSPDWHCMNSAWSEQKNSADATECAYRQGPIWRANSPAVLGERCSTMSALSAAWIILIAGDRKIIDRAMPEITEALQQIPYSKLYHASFFFAVNVISELMAMAEK